MLRETATRGLTFALTVIFGAVFTVGIFIIIIWAFNTYIGFDNFVKWLFKMG